MIKIFLDLDGTLARFNVRNALERFDKEEGFFAYKSLHARENGIIEDIIIPAEYNKYIFQRYMLLNIGDEITLGGESFNIINTDGDNDVLIIISIDDISKATSQFDSGYDQTLSDLSTVLAGDKSTKYIEAWARTQFGDKIYEAASAIKNGASTAIEGVADYMSLKNTFGGSWRNPKTPRKRKYGPF